jgi:hypothetical protein
MLYDESFSSTDEDFLVISRDLLRATMVAKFDPIHRFIIGEAFEESFLDHPFSDLLPFRIDFAAIGPVIEIDPAALEAKFLELVAFRVFLPCDQDTHVVNHDFRLWLERDGTPRLTENQIRWCTSTLV